MRRVRRTVFVTSNTVQEANGVRLENGVRSRSTVFDMAEEMPVPSWKRTRPAAPARVPLSRDVIVDTAIKILDRDGLDGVSMRRVAEELGTGAASLYAHVANKDELLDLVHDKVMSEVKVPAPDPDRWQEQLREVAMQSFRVYTSHRDIARVSLANVPTGPNALRIAEGMLAIMIGAGVPPKVAAYAVDRLALYIAADAFEGTLYERQHQESGLTQDEFMESHFGKVREFFQSLPAERYPFIIKHVDELMSGSSDERFEFGLDMMIRSLGTYVDP
jgi:AcrR family transcriptional regulator